MFVLLGKLTEPAISGEDASFVDLIPNMLNFVVTLNQNALKDPKAQKLIQDPNTKFDLVVVNPFLAGEIGYYLGHRFKAPLATYFTGKGFPGCRRLNQLTGFQLNWLTGFLLNRLTIHTSKKRGLRSTF